MLLLKKECTSVFLSEICVNNDEQFTFVDGVDELAKLLGYSKEEMKVKSREGLLKLVEPSFRTEIKGKIKQQLDERQQIEIMLPVYDQKADLRWIMCKGCVIENEETDYICAVLMDLTYSKKNYDVEKEKISELEKKAQQDSLTKLYNAATCRKMAEEYLKGQGKCALFILDIDHFKTINDRYGHMFGDAVILKAAQCLQKLFRTNDILGRVGGDEFMILMKDIENIEIIQKRCKQLNESFKEGLENQIPDVKVGFSIGVAMAPIQGNTYFDLFLAADQALYHAKARGRRQYVIYSEETCGPVKNKVQMKYENYDKSMLSGYID